MEKDLNQPMMKKDNKVANHGLQIIKHPSYHSNRLLSWFDIRVFYVRVNSFMVDGYTPQYLTLNHIPLDPDTVLEVNGKRCTLQSEGSSCRLKRNRVDKKFQEATFVSTDSIRLSGGVKFEVFNGENLILSGALEMHNEKDDNIRNWSMSCKAMACDSDGYFKDKRTAGCDSMPPMIEVYVAGSFSGTPVILTKTLQIGFRKKHNTKGMLDTIPEYDATECQSDVAPQLDLQMAGCRGFKYGNEDDYDNSLFWSQREFMEGEDGALSWFNAGVRVGVGIGLGVCLGVGVGVGLLFRTYKSTTRNFRRWF